MQNFECVLGAWRDHEPELRAYLVHRLGDRHAADDILQDVFLKSMRTGAAFCALDQPRAWLFQVVRNALVDHLRQRRPTEPLPEDLPATHEQRDPIDELDGCLIRNLADMAPDERAIVEQCDIQGMRQQAYATQHGLTLAATKSRLLRARQHLRESLIRNCQVRFDEAGRVCCHVPRPPGA